MGGFRWKTMLFYGILTFLTVVAIILVIVVNSQTKFTAGELQLRVDLILDAGHGGLDGGAVSPDGVCEAPLTLSIAKKAQALFGFCGTSVLMTREDENSLDFRPNASARENKNADLNARLALARRYPSVPFLSIHLNQFSDSRYSGAQVFYNSAGETLAQCIQEQLRSTVDPENGRACKPAPESVFLMKNLSAPAVIVECGFLSNSEECALLQQSTYQTKLALAVLGGYARYDRG